MAQRQFRSDDTSPKWTPQYGNGSDGDKVVSSSATYDGANAGGGATANSGQRNVSIDNASSFQNGDLVLIHQSRGTGAGAWELNKIASGGGTTSLVMAYDLCNTYTESGASQFQVLELKQYKDVTVNSGQVWSAPAWDGSKGGIIAFLSSKNVSIVGTISAKAKGFAGGDGASIGSRQGRQGEGSTGTGGAAQGANNTGGGGGVPDTAAGDGGGGGGGGSHATSGGTGTQKNNGAGGIGASTIVGTADLVTMLFGGGGGEGGADDSGSHGRGGYGGGIAIVIGRNITITGGIDVSGENGTTPTGQDGGHGGGAGGSSLVKGERVTLGSGLVVASGGTGSSESSVGGTGGVGRNHSDYALSISGTTSPTLDSRQDKSLLKKYAGAAIMVLF